MFVNELSKSEISTFAKLRISSHDLHIEKGRHKKTILSERNAFYVAWLLKMRNILLWNVIHFQLIEILFFDDLEEIVPSFSSKNEDEKFSFIMECKDYDISCVCITNICIMFRAREELVKSISAP